MDLVSDPQIPSFGELVCLDREPDITGKSQRREVSFMSMNNGAGNVTYSAGSM